MLAWLATAVRFRNDKKASLVHREYNDQGYNDPDGQHGADTAPHTDPRPARYLVHSLHCHSSPPGLH